MRDSRVFKSFDQLALEQASREKKAYEKLKKASPKTLKKFKKASPKMLKLLVEVFAAKYGK